jgi:hypothetical protein
VYGHVTVEPRHFFSHGRDNVRVRPLASDDKNHIA